MPNPSEIEELEALTEMFQLRGWSYFKNLLHKHKIHCIGQSHKHLDKHEDRKAGEWLARSKEPARILTMIQERKQELSNKREEIV